MFTSALTKLDRAKHHINDLEGQFKEFVARKPHRFSVHHDQKTGQAQIKIRFVEDVPKSFPVIVGDAIHNIKCALDHLMWELIGLDGGTQDKYLQFICRSDRANYEGTCRAVKTPSQWVKDYLLSIEAFNGGKGQVFVVVTDLDSTDKHRIIRPVLRATRHPPFQTFNADGSPAVYMEGNIFVGVGNAVPIGSIPMGGSVELENDASCPPSIFLEEVPETDAIRALHIFHNSAYSLIKQTVAEVAKHKNP